MEDNVVLSEENTTLEYVEHAEFAACLTELNELKEEVADIRDNHLVTILAKIKTLATKDEVKEAVGHFRWYIMAAAGLLAIVLTILQVLG